MVFEADRASLSLERGVHQKIHRRGPLVAWDKTFPEVAREIVVGGLRLGLDNAADRIREAPLHVEAGECGEDALHFVRRVEFNATLSQINCARRSSRPCSRAKSRAASAPSISKRFGPVQ